MNGWKHFLIAVLLLAVIGLMTWALFRFTTPAENPALFIALIVLLLGAVVYFTYFVTKPWALWYAKKRAREYCESGDIKDPEIYDMLCRKLSKAKNDPEAASLNDKLRKLGKGKEEGRKEER